jgi:hypothetical protein
MDKENIPLKHRNNFDDLNLWNYQTQRSDGGHNGLKTSI